MENSTTVVKCPEPLAPLFAQAEQIMQGFFTDLERVPERGQIHIQGVRYMLMRTDSMAIELQEELRKTFGETGARQIRYKLAKACGIRDAKLFAERLEIEDPTMRMALGPVHFAHVGWANVNIFEDSAPQPNEDFFLAYDHPYSFEAASYLENEIVSTHPVCHMNAGYSAGWGEASFDIDLKAEELTCRAKGDAQCIFVMAHPRNFERLRDEFARARGLI
ncbi:XylR N-terminal domain-containing protein [Enhygromyxa salina]|uniref:V4R domain protein n=1 Tax=Enhygromyxa salina TaxID=215803 RepID=A0A2S9YM77_9BACT|nr:XylR N-terminal domain-containing protein [Enhygromyxa salina]PRQ06197.1 V4R domain protein [Enhygromyxa salina]